MKQLIIIIAENETASVFHAQLNVLSYLGSRIATLVDEDNPTVSPIELDESFSMTDKDFEQISKRCNEKGCIPLIIFYHENDMCSYKPGDGLMLKLLTPPACIKTNH